MTLMQAIMATAELCGTKLSEPAADMMLSDLEQFPEPAILAALAQCRRELKGRLTVAEIVTRIDDGRPGADEAWSLLPWDEEATAILTDEMNMAQGIARPAYDANDRMGARLAFREAYTRLVAEARMGNRPAVWQVSLGWDKSARLAPIRDALAKGRIPLEAVRRYLSPREVEELGQTDQKRLEE